jgi:hypothetical protein
MGKEETKGVKEKFSEAKKKKDAIKKYYNDIAMKNAAIDKLKDAERKKRKKNRQANNPFGGIKGFMGFGTPIRVSGRRKK